MTENNTRAWMAVLTKGSAALKKKLTAKHGDKPEFQRLLKSTGQDKETWHTMYQRKKAKEKGEVATERRKQMSLKAYGATKGTGVGGEHGGGFDFGGEKDKATDVLGRRGAGEVKTLSVAEYLKQKEKEEKEAAEAKRKREMKEGYIKKINKKAKNLQLIMKGREKLGPNDRSKTWQQNRADALKVGRAMKEEVDQISEAPYTGKGNHRPGWMLRADPALAAKFKEIEKKHALRKKYMGKTSDEIAKMKKEEVEQIDEISKKTLGSYVKKAAPQLATSLMTAATTKDIANAEFHGKRYAKRQKGINKAADKLAKEEVEQIDERNKENKRKKEKWEIAQSAKKLKVSPSGSAMIARAMAKQMTRKMSEESEQVDEAAPYTLGGKVDKAHTYKVHRQDHKGNWSHHPGDEYHSLDDAKKVARNMTRGSMPVKTKITRHARDELAGPKGKLPEEVEQIDELKKSTLASYIPKASKERGWAGYAAGGSRENWKKKEHDDYFRVMGKRQKGIERATAKLAKEEVEQIDERGDYWHPDPEQDRKVGGRGTAILARQTATKTPGKNDKLDMLKKLAAAGKKIAAKPAMAEGLDKVGKETSDIDNDKDVDKTDMYLHNRRDAIKKAILKKKLNEGKSGTTIGSKIGAAFIKYGETRKKGATKKAAALKAVSSLVKEGKAAAAADKAIALKRGKGNKINRKPTMDVDLKAQPSPEPTHSGEDDSANVKI